MTTDYPALAADLRERLDAATDLPWASYSDGLHEIYCSREYDDGETGEIILMSADDSGSANAELTTAAVNALPALLDHLDALTAERDALRGREWQPEDGDTRCQECHQPNATWFADNQIWNAVMGGPGATSDPGGCLCPRCFMIRAEATYPGVVWRLTRAVDPELIAERDRLRAKVQQVEALADEWIADGFTAEAPDTIREIRAALEGPDA